MLQKRYPWYKYLPGPYYFILIRNLSVYKDVLYRFYSRDLSWSKKNNLKIKKRDLTFPNQYETNRMKSNFYRKASEASHIYTFSNKNNLIWLNLNDEKLSLAL